MPNTNESALYILSIVFVLGTSWITDSVAMHWYLRSWRQVIDKWHGLEKAGQSGYLTAFWFSTFVRIA